ncbi:ABC transporter, permease protein [Pseudoramibacter alactolyticus ATCC 23263]|uniref:ABC transporter, permease protein n=2 Tax=Pseudoramibacter TaxID=113286 RepID=E6MDM0_9FIRM|nr:ABC transporter, permease protein [Pseudoramibacter alactolyticus ATCC 23263]
MRAMFIYWARHADGFVKGLLAHLAITGITLISSLVLAAALTLLIWRNRRLSAIVIQIFGAVYAIPSLALFAILIPITGLGMPTAVLVLTVYNQFLLLRNIIAGLEGINPAITEAATGMGMTPFQVLIRVQLPLAMPAIVAGIRLAVISTIGIATIAATVDAGGLGTLLFQGLRAMNLYKLIGATLLCFVVAAAVGAALRALEKRVTPQFESADPPETKGAVRNE